MSDTLARPTQPPSTTALPEPPPVKFYRKKEFIILAVFFFLVFVVLLSSRITGRPPRVDQVTPRIGVPGDVMVIQGRFFGKTRKGAEVRIAGFSPLSAAYLEWKDDRISLQIPDDLGSGFVNVVTRNGRSNGVLFTNRDQIPRVVSGPRTAGTPYILDVGASSGSIGSLLTIRGMDFGLNRGNSAVYFTWIAGSGQQQQQQDQEADLSALTPAQEYDLDYESWSDREIQVRVPDGASSGHIVVVTDKGKSNALYLEIESPVGVKLFPDKRTYSVQYGIDVRNVSSGPGNSLTLWVPQVAGGPEQRGIQLVSQEPAPLFQEVNGVKIFQLKDLAPGQSYRVSQNLMVNRYSVQTKINTANLPRSYDTGTRLYRRYTAPDFVVASADPRVPPLAQSIVRGVRIPYFQAQAVYGWIVSRLTLTEEGGQSDFLRAIDQKQGNSYAYAVLFCALTRSIGIPSRPVAGYLVDAGKRSFRHYWAEFYLEGVGWIPVDPAMGEGTHRLGYAAADIKPQEFYFGNLDAGRITFSKGVVALNPLRPDGRTIRRADVPSLQSLHEEASGNLFGFSASWSGLQVLGIY